MKIYCCCCGKQAIKDQNPSRYDKYVTKLEGSKAAFKADEVICGYCAEELDENGLFPEEAMMCTFTDVKEPAIAVHDIFSDAIPGSFGPDFLYRLIGTKKYT